MNTANAAASRHLHDSPDWYTPPAYVEAARAVMGGIDLDPASHPDANARIGATRFYTEADNGLVLPWAGRVFVNPPGGRLVVPAFWRKLMNSLDTIDQAIWIGFSLEQLQTLQGSRARFTPNHFPICITSKQIAFIENAAMREERKEREGEEFKERTSPTHSNFITYIGPETVLFEAVFSQFGDVRL